MSVIMTRAKTRVVTLLLFVVFGGLPHARLQGQTRGNQEPDPAVPHVNVSVGYRAVESWPQKPADASWTAMPSIAIDHSGNIWTFNRGPIPVQVYRSDGTLVKMWGQGVFRSPHQLRFDNEGNLWAADTGTSTLSKFTPDGKLLMTLGVKDHPGVDETHFNRPTDIAITPSGDLFVSDGYGNSRVVHFDKNGKFIKSWGRLGSAPGEFSVVHGIALDSKGLLYVADRNNARIQVFDQTGKYITEWRDVVTPWAITITANDDIYVCGSTPMQWWEASGPTAAGHIAVPPKDQIIIRFDRTGRVRQIWSFPKPPEGQQTKPGELSWVHGIAVDANGDLYLGDIRGQRAQRFVRVESDVPLSRTK